MTLYLIGSDRKSVLTDKPYLVLSEHVLRDIMSLSCLEMEAIVRHSHIHL